MQKHLQQGPGSRLQRAHRLGKQAVTLGLETLELARIHERVLVALQLSTSKNRLIKRAEIFYRGHHPVSWRRIAPPKLLPANCCFVLPALMKECP